MMTSIYQLLTSLLGIPVWQDFIPEGESKPAASYLVISRENERVLKGKTILRRINVQVSISSDKSRLETEDYCNKLRAIDGSSSLDNFKYISILSDTDEPRDDSSDPVYTTNIELQLTPKQTQDN
ncbi:hypothetical protein [Vibrio sp. E150_018]